LDVAAARALLRDAAERHQYDEPRDANPGWLYIGPGQDAAVLLDAAQVAAARTVERALIRMRAVREHREELSPEDRRRAVDIMLDVADHLAAGMSRPARRREAEQTVRLAREVIALRSRGAS
jgi:hypothetical protein